MGQSIIRLTREQLYEKVWSRPVWSLAKADEILFPGLTDQEHVNVELFREFTKILAKQFPGAGLHGREKDFVERCIKLFERANYRGKSNE